MKYNRYKFLKERNKRSVVLIKSKKRYVTFDRDLEILKYIGFKFEYEYCNLSYLDKYSIDINVIIKYCFSDTTCGLITDL